MNVEDIVLGIGIVNESDPVPRLIKIEQNTYLGDISCTTIVEIQSFKDESLEEVAELVDDVIRSIVGGIVGE